MLASVKVVIRLEPHSARFLHINIKPHMSEMCDLHRTESPILTGHKVGNNFPNFQ